MKLKGFTLAEVLITLGIIGIVSAITIPIIRHKYMERQTVAKLKETYSILSQAIRSIEDEVGTPDDWDLSGGEYLAQDSEVIAEKLLPALKVAHDCGVSVDNYCMYDGVYKYLKGSNASAYGQTGIYKIILLNGTSIGFGQWSASERIDFFIDINGSRIPNTVGRDLFVISWFKNKGLYPLGAPQYNDCSKNQAGWGCAAYILKNGNMDYLK